MCFGCELRPVEIETAVVDQTVRGQSGTETYEGAELHTEGAELHTATVETYEGGGLHTATVGPTHWAHSDTAMTAKSPPDTDPVGTDLFGTELVRTSCPCAAWIRCGTVRC